MNFFLMMIMMIKLKFMQAVTTPQWTAAGTCSPLSPVRKRHFFAPFIYKMHYFTKTGSGQT
jgi:hypothetical protein